MNIFLSTNATQIEWVPAAEFSMIDSVFSRLSLGHLLELKNQGVNIDLRTFMEGAQDILNATFFVDSVFQTVDQFFSCPAMKELIYEIKELIVPNLLTLNFGFDQPLSYQRVPGGNIYFHINPENNSILGLFTDLAVVLCEAKRDLMPDAQSTSIKSLASEGQVSLLEWLETQFIFKYKIIMAALKILGECIQGESFPQEAGERLPAFQQYYGSHSDAEVVATTMGSDERQRFVDIWQSQYKDAYCFKADKSDEKQLSCQVGFDENKWFEYVKTRDIHSNKLRGQLRTLFKEVPQAENLQEYLENRPYSVTLPQKEDHRF